MKHIYFFIVTIGMLFTFDTVKSQTDSLKPADILNMSLEELLYVKVNVSTTIPTNVFNSPSTVTIVDRELIDQYNFSSVAEAIRQVSGMEILQTVIDKNVPTSRGILQNFYANKVLIMINNVPVWNPTYGNSTLDRVHINEVERIEVLKGPASVLYGTNAYNGVINIILRSPDKSSLHSQISVGFPSMGEASVNYGEQKGNLSWSISGSSTLELRKPYLFNGANDPDTNITLNNSFVYQDDTLYNYAEELRRSNINMQMQYKSHIVQFNSFINSYTHPGVNVSYKTGANQTINDKGSLLSYAFIHDLSAKTHINANTYLDYHYRDQIMSQTFATSARFSSYRLVGLIKLNHQFTENLNLELGGELYNGKNMGHEIIDVSTGMVLHQNITSKEGIIEGSAFSQLQFKYNKANLLAGLRYTHNNNFGGDISPRITGLYNINKTNTIKLVYGQSFRTPNLLELYFDHWTIKGNPNLKPEKCTSAEFIYMTNIKKFFAQITAYQSQYSNLIHRVVDTVNSTSTPTYANASNFESFGIETELRYQDPNMINAYINYNYCTGNTKGIEENFKYVPKHTIAVGINKPIKKFFIASNAYMYSSAQGPWEPINEQLLVDAHLGYNYKSAKGFKLRHTLSFKNITASDMLVPEYIRQRPNVNSLATTGFGRQVIYTLKIEF